MQKPTKDEFFKALREDLDPVWDEYVEAIEKYPSPIFGSWEQFENMGDIVNNFLEYVFQ